MTQQQLIHALSTPVTNILLNTQLAIDLCQQKRDPSNLSYYLEQSLLAGKYLQGVIKNNDANYTSNQFSIHTALMTVINLCQYARRQCQIIKYFAFDKNLQIIGNQFNFQEALICLLNNAVESYQHLNPNKVIILTASHRESNFYLSITDGGVGMNWLQQKVATLPGISYKNKHTGVGLGFAKKVFCKDMGGQLKILSKTNRGTTISVSLPMTKI